MATTITGNNIVTGSGFSSEYSTSARPAFHAMATAMNTVTSGTLLYGGVTFNQQVNGVGYDGVSDFTAPITGIYQFHTSAYTHSGAGSAASIKFAVNGVMRQIAEVSEIGGSYGYDGLNMSVILKLNAGDVVNVQHRAGGGVHLNQNNNSFSGAMIAEAV